MSTTLQQTYTDEEVMEMITPYIGTLCTDVIQGAIERATLRPVRVPRPGFAYTMEVRKERLKLKLDEDGVIRKISFG